MEQKTVRNGLVVGEDQGMVGVVRVLISHLYKCKWVHRFSRKGVLH